MTDRFGWWRALLVAPICAAVVAGCSGDDAGPAAVDPPSTAREADRSCSGEPTRPQAEGPFFSDDAPRKSDPARDVDDEGTVATISGTVFGADCRPRGGVRVDVWQTDADGEYDNRGYRLRGHQLTDRDGTYRFRTILPGEYTGRTEHIHVKIRERIDGEELLTTQLYVPGLSSAEADIGLYDDENLLTVVDENSDPRRYRFDFMLP